MKHATPETLAQSATPADYRKLIVKDASHLSKAGGMAAVKNYRFAGGKKDSVVLFFKKSKQAKEFFKQLKAEYGANQLLAARCALVKGKDGLRSLQIEPLEGGFSVESLQKELSGVLADLAVQPVASKFAEPEKEEDEEKEDEQPQKSASSQGGSLTGSVGRGGVNAPEDVRRVQTLLNARGAKLEVDGRCGKLTIATIELLQSKIGIAKPDGRIDPGGKTWKALQTSVPDTQPVTPPPPVQPAPPSSDGELSGSVGKGGANVPEDVRRVQTLLNKAGAALSVDGSYGPKTLAAIELYEKTAGTGNQGLVLPGGATWKALLAGTVRLPAPQPPQPGTGNTPPKSGFHFERGTIEGPGIPSDFVRITKQKEVTAEMMAGAKFYLDVFVATYKGNYKPHYGKFIRFRTQDGREFLAHFEEHYAYGADPTKPHKPHPSIGLFKKRE